MLRRGACYLREQEPELYFPNLLGLNLQIMNKLNVISKLKTPVSCYLIVTIYVPPGGKDGKSIHI